MIRFGPFELDPGTSELRRNGELIPLAPQPFRLLLALASRPGELLTRDALRQQVWGEGTFVDFERGLNFCILQVRSALGDDAKNPLYIETLPKRGYRFIPQKTEAPKRNWKWPAIATAALIVVFAAAWQLRPAPKERPSRIAVLPFDDLSPARDEALADGMTEELITHLGRHGAQRLGVIARTSVIQYRGTKKSVQDIARELGVDYVVEGSVRREADRVRVTAQLIEAQHQTHLWAESFDRSGADALALQEDIAGRIASALQIELLGGQANAHLTSHVAEAHDAYLHGDYRRAIRLEPDFALPYIALAESLHMQVMGGKLKPKEAVAEIRQASETALRLAPSFAQTHGVKAMLALWYDWNWSAAEESYRRAIELNPNEPGTLHDHGWLLITRGAFDDGIAEIRRAQEIDPVSPRANMDVAWAYIYTRRYADAVREARRVLQRWPSAEEANGCIEVAELLSGKRAVARETRSTKSYAIAAHFAMTGDRDHAIAALTLAKEERSTAFVLAGVDPKLDSLHGDPRYEELLASVGLTAVRPRTR